MELRRGEEARDHQLPHPEARAGRPVLRAHLWTHQGLGVPLRQIQAHPLQGQDLRALRRRGDQGQGPPRADGPHRAGGPRQPHLVLQGHPQPDRPDAGHQPPPAGKSPVLCKLYRRGSRPDPAGEKAAADREGVPRDAGAVRRRIPRRDGRRGHPGPAGRDRPGPAVRRADR